MSWAGLGLGLPRLRTLHCGSRLRPEAAAAAALGDGRDVAAAAAAAAAAGWSREGCWQRQGLVVLPLF